jgi:FkbM family methyltransferase
MAQAYSSTADKGHFRKAKKLRTLIRNSRWRDALRRERVAASVEHLDVPFPCTPSTIIDVGAHHGQFALFSRTRFPGATVHCIEPLPQSAAKLRRVFEGDDKVNVIESAAGATAITTSMHVSKKTDSSSLLAIRKEYVTAFPGTDEASEEIVEVKPLDKLLTLPLPHPVLLKIDVQGGELDVLRGAPTVLESCEMAFIECSFVEFYEGQALADEVIAFLLERGLRLVGAFSLVRNSDTECLQADLLFARR